VALTPTIWIWRANAPTLPDWLMERIVDGAIRDDGTFELEASDGVVSVGRGDAVFEVAGQVFACPPKGVAEKLAKVAGADNFVVAELEQKRDAQQRDRSAAPARPGRSAADRPLKIKPMIGTPCAPQFVLVEALEVDDTYQRSIEAGTSKKLVATIAENWDWRLCLPLLVSRRGGRLFVIDGQHRKEAADLRGDIHSLPAVVFDLDGPQAEAELFIQANRSRRAMGKLDDFHAAVVAGNAKAMAVHDVVVGSGLTVGRNQAWQYWKVGEVIFVGAIERALHAAGKERTARALSMIALAFEGQILVGAGAIFEALVAFTRDREKAGGTVEDELMIRVLADRGLIGWKEAVEGVESAGERADSMHGAITAAYTEAEAQ
jgi:hypothetical protein